MTNMLLIYLRIIIYSVDGMLPIKKENQFISWKDVMY